MNRGMRPSVTPPGGKTEVVVAVMKKVLGFDVTTGKPLWNCNTGINWYMCPTPVVHEGIVYAVGDALRMAVSQFAPVARATSPKATWCGK